jgi:hypothetical protein
VYPHWLFVTRLATAEFEIRINSVTIFGQRW